MVLCCSLYLCNIAQRYVLHYKCTQRVQISATVAVTLTTTITHQTPPPKSNQFLLVIHCSLPKNSSKFVNNFLDILLTDKQTNERWLKHNLLGGGNFFKLRIKLLSSSCADLRLRHGGGCDVKMLQAQIQSPSIYSSALHFDYEHQRRRLLLTTHPDTASVPLRKIHAYT